MGPHTGLQWVPVTQEAPGGPSGPRTESTDDRTALSVEGGQTGILGVFNGWSFSSDFDSLLQANRIRESTKQRSSTIRTQAKL